MARTRLSLSLSPTISAERPEKSAGSSTGTPPLERRSVNEKVNVEPTPSVLLTAMSPPMTWMRRLEIVSLSPVPPNFRVVVASA